MTDGGEPWNVYPVDAYHVVTKDDAHRPALSREDLHRRMESYKTKGMRYSVGAVMLAHREQAPHVLLLEDIKTEKRPTGLFSGKVNPWEEPVVTLKRLLGVLLGDEPAKGLCVGSLIGTFWRSSIDGPLLPYLPLHVTRPAECIRIYQVVLPTECSFHLPPGVSLRAVAFGDLLSGDFDPAISGLVNSVSRFTLKLFQAERC